MEFKTVKQLRPYLLERKFYTVTDHQPLRWLINHKNPGSRLMHWRLAMEEYEYDIIYKPGILNTNAEHFHTLKILALHVI